MIIYISLADQIWDEEDEYMGICFAWYDTVTSMIISFNGENVFDSWADFEYNFNLDEKSTMYNIERFYILFPYKI